MLTARGWVLWGALSAGLALCVGCSTPYVLRQAAGQVQILASARPVSDVASDPSTRESLRQSLLDIDDALEFARREGLDVGNAYQTVIDLGARPPVWVLYACPPDRLEPATWTFPIVGRFPYKGFFDRAGALREARLWQEREYDTVIVPASAYSTLGWFPDPLFSSFLEEDPGTRAETLFHELTHRTLFLTDSVPLNENLADFVGGELARRYLAERHGSDSAELREYDELVHDREVFRSLMTQVIERLEAAFESTSREERLEARHQILADFTREIAEAEFRTDGYRGWAGARWNLALIVLSKVYRGEQDLFRAAFEECDQDLPRFFEMLRGLSGEDDPLEKLREKSGPGGS